MAKTLEFYFDFGSPFTYLAYTRMPGLVERTGAEVVYRRVALGAVFKLTENPSSVSIPAKGAYFRNHDLPRFIRRYGIPFALPRNFPVITLRLMRGAVVAAEDGCEDAYLDAVFKAMWGDSRDMTDADTVGEILSAAGLDAARIAGRIGEDSIKNALKAETEAAVERGVFGAPTFFVEDAMFFGQDRLDFVEEAFGE